MAVDDAIEDGDAAAEALVAGAGTGAALAGAASPPAEAEGAANALPLASSTTSSSSSSSSSSFAVAAAGAAMPAAAEAGAAGGKTEAAEAAAPLTALSPAGAIVDEAAAMWLSGVSMAGWLAKSRAERLDRQAADAGGAAEMPHTAAVKRASKRMAISSS
jgi:hypothetical protein